MTVCETRCATVPLLLSPVLYCNNKRGFCEYFPLSPAGSVSVSESLKKKTGFVVLSAPGLTKTAMVSRVLIVSVLLGTALLTALALLAAGSGRPTVLCIGGCFTHGPPVPLAGDDDNTGKANAVAARQQSLEQFDFDKARMATQ